MSETAIMPTPLDRTAFAKYLKRGHGRAMMHVKSYGLVGVDDLVLDACLHNRSYDAQCEESRIPWLFSMLENQPEKRVIREELLTTLFDHLQQVDPAEDDENTPSITQCYELCGCFARSGDSKLADMLRSFAKNQDFDWDRLAPHWEWVKLDGLPALLEVARRAGQWLRQNSEEGWQGWPFLDSLLEECQLEQAGREALVQAAETDADIAAFFKFNSARDETKPDTISYADRFRQSWPVSRIIDDAYRHIGDFPGNYTRFGRYAGTDDLQLIWQKLLECEDEAACCRLLWVFRRTPIPALHARVLGWLDSNNVQLQEAAIEALGRIQDIKIAQEAQKRLQTDPANHTLLPLLRLNAEYVDNPFFNLILQRLPTSDDDTAHDIGSDLLDVANDCPQLSTPALLNWIYEHTPCSICRSSAVHRLHERGLLTEQQLEECRNDADSSTRELGNKPQGAF